MALYLHQPTSSIPSWQRNMAITVTSMALALPMSLQRSLAALSACSLTAVMALALVVAVISLRGVQALQQPDGWRIPEGVELWHWDVTALHAVPVIVFAFQCHVQVVPVHAELSETTTLFGALTGVPAAAQAKLKEWLEAP